MASYLLDADDEAITPIDKFLARQADLSAVERFARSDLSDRTGRWSDLIDISDLGPGEHYRFDVDLDSCTGCKACVTACHSLNGLDEGESFRSVGLLVGSDVLPGTGSVDARKSSGPEAPSPMVNQTVTTACHHCLDPACLTGCPAEAYEKDPTTGIVRHLDDACIGCEYCTMTCPYDVPVYNSRLGIVRKCDMCSSRLAEGEAPACVQGCPNGAIQISAVDVDELRGQLETDRQALMPEAPDSRLTIPTTSYRRSQTMASSTVPVDDQVVQPAPAHTPLAFMLVLSQLAIGLHLVRVISAAWLTDVQSTAAAALVVAVTGIAAAISVLHLGQPLKAWRVVLGIRHSWLSREAVAVGGFLLLASLSVGAEVGLIGGADVLAAATLVVGLVTLTCSVMIYGVTGRTWWRPTLVGAKFGLTTLGLGLSALLAVVALSGSRPDQRALTVMAIGLAATILAKVVAEASVFWADDAEQQGTSRLLQQTLAPQFKARLAMAVAGAVALLLLLLGRNADWAVYGFAVVSLFAVLAGELMARSLFFTASVSRQMPGRMR